MGSQLTGRVVALLLLGSLVAAGPAVTAGAATAPMVGRPLSGQPRAPAIVPLNATGEAYTHLSNPYTNIVGYSSWLDAYWLNGTPGARFFATNVEYAENLGNLQRDPNPLGLSYQSAYQRWSVFEETASGNMPGSRSWNIYIPPQDGLAVTQISAGGNISGSQTIIDDSQFNNQPSAVVFVAPAAMVPAGALPDSTYLPPPVARYAADLQQWTIMSGDGSAMPTNRAFFVLRANSAVTAYHHVTSNANIDGEYTTLDNPLINQNPQAMILVGLDYGTGVTNRASPHGVGLRYDTGSGRWWIFNEDDTAMSAGLMFNVLIIPPTTGYLLHTATPANTTLNRTQLDDPNLNGNPDARVYVTHNWNPPENDNQNDNDHPLGVRYLAPYWYIENRDGAAMPTPLTFNVYYTWPRGDSNEVSASSTNTTTPRSLTLDSPLLDYSPYLAPQLTFNATPGGVDSGVSYTAQAGLAYTSSLAVNAWQAVNDPGPDFPAGLTFNVLSPPHATFVVSATVDTGASWFDFSNPFSNNNPGARLLVTPRDNGGFDPNNVGVFYDGVAHEWGIFHENPDTPMAVGSTFDVFLINCCSTYLPTVER